MVAENDGDGRFQTGSRINAIYAHARKRNRQILGKMYTDKRVIPLLQEIDEAGANVRVRFLTGSF